LTLTDRKSLDFEFRIPEVLRSYSFLGHRQRLLICLSNRAIDPITSFSGSHKSRIEVALSEDTGDRICFRVLTSFAKAADVRKLISVTKSSHEERTMLEKFGAHISTWDDPTLDEKAEGFQAISIISVPIGVKPRKE